jgi:hypothetical protein
VKKQVRTLALVVVVALSLGATALAATTDVVGRMAGRATAAPAPKPAVPTPKKYSCTTKGDRTTCVGQTTVNGKTYTTTVVKVDGKVVSRSTKAKPKAKSEAKAKADAQARAEAKTEAKAKTKAQAKAKAGKKTPKRR